MKVAQTLAAFHEHIMREGNLNSVPNGTKRVLHLNIDDAMERIVTQPGRPRIVDEGVYPGIRLEIPRITGPRELELYTLEVGDPLPPVPTNRPKSVSVQLERPGFAPPSFIGEYFGPVPNQPPGTPPALGKPQLLVPNVGITVAVPDVIEPVPPERTPPSLVLECLEVPELTIEHSIERPSFDVNTEVKPDEVKVTLYRPTGEPQKVVSTLPTYSVSPRQELKEIPPVEPVFVGYQTLNLHYAGAHHLWTGEEYGRGFTNALPAGGGMMGKTGELLRDGRADITGLQNNVHDVTNNQWLEWMQKQKGGSEDKRAAGSSRLHTLAQYAIEANMAMVTEARYTNYLRGQVKVVSEE